MEPLPLDILLHIIDLLAGGDYGDIKSLQILSQACKSMVPLCRKHLFSSIRLRSEFQIDRFSDLLTKNPDIARYVRSLNYALFNRPTYDHELNILDMLKEHSSLQSIELLSSPGFILDWSNFPESIRSSLVFLIQLPTVTHLNIRSFKGFPATALSRCSNLIDLRLARLKIAPPEVNQVIPRSKIPTPVSLYTGTKTYDGLAVLLNSASLRAGGPIVDFSLLQKASFDVEHPGDIGHVCGLIKATTRLQYIYIRGNPANNWPVGLTGLGASLAINAHQTLKLLALSYFTGANYDHLCGLGRELRFMAGNNVLEQLELDVVVYAVALQNESEDWSAFDSVLAESGAFPMLHRVTILLHILCVSTDDDVNDVDVEEGILISLKEDRFPRLAESKAVEFNFTVKHFYSR